MISANRSFRWLSEFFAAHSGEQQGYTIPGVIQPTLDCACDWPLEYRSGQKTGNLGAGNTNFDLYPGEGGFPTAYSDPRHHARMEFLFVSTSLSLGINVYVKDISGGGAQIVDRLYAGAPAGSHYPLMDILPDRRYLTYPYILTVQILSAAGTETYAIHLVRWDRKEGFPIV